MKYILLGAALAALAACGQNTSTNIVQDIRQAEVRDQQQAQSAQSDAQRFLTQVRARPGVIARPSGLLYEVTHRGANQNLPQPSPQAQVVVHYEGKLADGTVFDSSFARGEPATFPLSGVIPGFSEVIELMRPGDEVIAYFPPELGYGERGSPPAIPPNAALQFRIKLLSFQEPGGRVVRAGR